MSATASGSNSTSSSLGSVEPSTPVYVKNAHPPRVPAASLGLQARRRLALREPQRRVLDAADGGRVLSRDVAVCGEIASTSGAWSIPVLKADGSCVWVFNGNERGTVNVPNGSSPSAGSSFITSDGREIRGRWHRAAHRSQKPRDVLWWVAIHDGFRPARRIVRLPREQHGQDSGGHPGRISACLRRFFLSPAGVLIDGADGSTVASNIASYGVLSIDNSSWLLTARKKTGRFRRRPARVGSSPQECRTGRSLSALVSPRLGRTIDRRTQRGGCSGNRSEHARRVRCASGLVAHSSRPLRHQHRR